MKRRQRLKGTEGTVKDENEKKNKLLMIRKKYDNLREWHKTLTWAMA